jgi:hypothetical protein
LLALFAVNTVQAMRSFQQQYSASKVGEVSTIRPWMTVHVIADLYHVPEAYLYRSLNMDDPGHLRHVTLYEIAHRKGQPVDRVIRTLQRAILMYRKEHSKFLTPTPTRHPTMKPLSPTKARAKY